MRVKCKNICILYLLAVHTFCIYHFEKQMLLKKKIKCKYLVAILRFNTPQNFTNSTNQCKCKKPRSLAYLLIWKKVRLAFDASWRIKSWTVLSNESFRWVKVKWPWVFHLLEEQVTAVALTVWPADCVITHLWCVCVGGLLSYGLETPLRGLIHQQPEGGRVVNAKTFLGAGIESACQAACRVMRLMGLHHHTDWLMTFNLSHPSWYFQSRTSLMGGLFL